MWKDQAQTPSSKWLLYLTIVVINLPVGVLHWLNIYFAVIQELSLISSILALVVLFLHILQVFYMFLTLPNTLRWRPFGKLQTIPKMQKERKNSIVKKSPLQNMSMRYRMYANGKLQMLKPCRVCNIIRPNKAVHWYQCDHCTQEFDHHWIWLSWCIGKGNYFYFWWFLIFLNLMLLLSIVQWIVSIISDKMTGSASYINDNIKQNPYNIICPLLQLPILGFTIPLLSFHLMLQFRRMTTYEYIKMNRRVRTSLTV